MVTFPSYAGRSSSGRPQDRVTWLVWLSPARLHRTISHGLGTAQWFQAPVRATAYRGDSRYVVESHSTNFDLRDLPGFSSST
jgi:hypothetical protein